MKNKIKIDLNIGSIQVIRLVHAISESSYTVAIKEEEMIKYKKLISLFNADISLLSSDSFIELDNFNISHSKPETSFSKFNYPLVFPHSIVNHCKKNWQKKRNIKYSFTGLVTESRMITLNNFINKIHPESQYKLKPKYKFLKRLKEKLYKKINKPIIESKKFGDLYLWESDKGRKFPHKSWDQDYYDVLSQSKFVLCPNGDFIWTYRFFESILCGAIPIVEDTCEIYEGYRYMNMNDDLESCIYSKFDAEYNYSLLLERMTFNIEELDKEIDFLKNKKPSCKEQLN